MSKKIVITGASGNLGRKLRAGLEPRHDLDLVLLDRDPRGDVDVVAADLSLYDPNWVRHFDAADVVVHLAANPSPSASWESLQRDNLDAVLNIFEAAVEGGVARVVFASTMTVMGGYSGGKVALTTELPPKPVTGYAASKVLGERIGMSFSTRQGLSVVCLRIGTIPEDEERPQPHWRLWDQLSWLSPRDFCQGVERAIEAADIRFAVLNLISDNTGTPIDLSETRRLIGYRPQDGWTVRPPSFTRALRNSIARKKPGLHRWLKDR